MGSNAIASGSVILTANADGLASGLDKAQKSVQTWGGKVGGSLTSLFNSKGGTMGAIQNLGGAVTNKLAGLASAAKGLLTGVGAGIGTFLGGPIGAAIGGAVGSAVGAIGETVVGALAEPFEKLDLFAGINKQAQSLGVSASQFQGLTKVMERAGIQGDQVGQTFAVMGKQISDVASGHGKGAALAFESLGLNAQELIGMKPDQQFMKIADAFQKMGPGAEQASAAVHLFGGHAAALLPELQKGGAGIQSFIESQKKVGTVLSDDQLQAAANASKAWKQAKVEISTTWEGLVNRATLIAAPVIAFVSKAVSKIFAFVQPVFDWVGRAVNRVADITTAVFEQLEKWFTQGVEWLKNLGAEVFSFAGEWPTVEDTVVGVFRAVGTAASYVWDVIKMGAGIGYTVMGGLVKAYGELFKAVHSVFELAKELPDEIRPKWLDKAIDGYGTMAKTVDTMGDKMLDWGKAGRETGIGDSAKDFNSWLDKALVKKTKLEQGVKTGGDFGGDYGGGDQLKLAGAISKGSKDAYSMVLKNDLGLNRTNDPQKEALKEHKKANKIGEKNERNTGEIVKKLDAIGVT